MASGAHVTSTQPPAPETTSVLEPQRTGTVDVVVDGAATLDGSPAVAVLTPQGAPAGTGAGRHEKDEIVAAVVCDKETCSIAVDPLEAQLNEVRRKLEAAAKARGGGGEEEELLPCIWRVHPSIRQQESEDYDPKLVSIGPLHRANTSLHPMEEVKLSYLNDLIGRHEDNRLGSYIEEIRKCEPRARKHYAEEIELTPDELVRTLVLDGCFIIEHFLKEFFKLLAQLDYVLDGLSGELQAAQLDDVVDRLCGERWGFSYLKRDLMLLENQIPFFVLVKLFDRTKFQVNLDERTKLRPMTTMLESIPLMDMTLMFLDFHLVPTDDRRHLRPQEDQVHHLLHLHHLCLDPSHVPNRSPRCSSSCNRLLYPIKNPINSIMCVFLALFYLLKIHKWHRYCCSTDKWKVPGVMPCAAELLSAGVKFKKNDKVSSFVKVSFTEGILEIPILQVDESTSSELRNLIALEQCCPQVGSYITGYAVFMDNLIDTESDVAILKKYGILESKLGNDEEVAKMFNTLCKGGTHLNYERNSSFLGRNCEKKHSNASLFNDLNAYVDVPHHKWRGSLKITYFSNPWTIISLFAGIVLLFLTAVQSYFTVFPRK